MTLTDGNLLVGFSGAYYTETAEKILKRLNEIRLEACKEGVTDPYTNKALTEADYIPLEWSSSLEAITRVRAAEATISQSHTKPNGNTCFTVRTTGGEQSWGENLAWKTDIPAVVIRPRKNGNYTLASPSGEIRLPLPLYQTKLTKNKLYVMIGDAVYSGAKVTPTVNVYYSNDSKLIAKAKGLTNEADILALGLTKLAPDMDYTLSYGTNITPILSNCATCIGLPLIDSYLNWIVGHCSLSLCCSQYPQKETLICPIISSIVFSVIFPISLSNTISPFISI